jgi:hypothetical protein
MAIALTLNTTGMPHKPTSTVRSMPPVKEKFDKYQQDYNARNYFFLPAVMTTSGRISGDFLLLLYILSHCQDANYFTRMGILESVALLVCHDSRSVELFN